jgi:hypothetical protein
MSFAPKSRHPEDLSDDEVRALRRTAFAAAVSVIDLWSARPPAMNRLDYLESFVRDQGVVDPVAHRYAVAQAALFLSEESAFAEYVPAPGLGDVEWLRFMIESRGASDTSLSFQLARALGREVSVSEVRRAREALGLGANSGAADDDTLAILRSVAAGDAPSARRFLTDPQWLRQRVVERDMSDGEIARELARVGLSCDRSTVRLYRRNQGLKRPGYAD